MKTVLTQSEIVEAITIYMQAVKGVHVRVVQIRSNFDATNPEERVEAYLTTDDSKQCAPILNAITKAMLVK